MCLRVDWSVVPAWVEAVGSVVTAGVALAAYRAWRPQLRGASKHTAAAKILEAARLARYHFYDARNTVITAGEFPAEYWASKARSNAQEADGFAKVYQGRWKHLWPQIEQLAILRAKAGALFGEEVASALDELARKARELQGFMENHLSELRAGPEIVSQWADQEWVRRVRNSVSVDPQDHTDDYSKEFEEKFEKLEKLVKPHI